MNRILARGRQSSVLRKNSNTIMREAKISPIKTSCKVFFAVLTVAAGAFYIVNISTISARGYDLAALEGDIEELTRDNQRLQFEIAKHKSMTSIESRLPGLELVVAEGVEYLDAGGTVVARR